MPTVDMNRRLWSGYDWKEGGEEWSANWGNTMNLWHGTLMPRIGGSLGDVRVLEIAPGYGRMTAFLKNFCRSLTLVDIAQNCIDHCRQRFDREEHLEYFVNNGRSLSFIDDESIDFVFSFDSLVHADLDVVTDYLAEIQRILVPGGRAFIHHSNLEALLCDENVNIKQQSTHLRARDVSAEKIAQVVAQFDQLECHTQELISWDESELLIDCLSSFIRRESPSSALPIRFENPNFYNQARNLKVLSEQYALKV